MKVLYGLLLCCLLLACRHKDDSIVTPVVPPPDTTHYPLYPQLVTYEGKAHISSYYEGTYPARDTTYDSTYVGSAMIYHPNSDSLTFHLYFWEHPSPSSLQKYYYAGEEVVSFRVNSSGVYAFSKAHHSNSCTLWADSLIIHHSYNAGLPYLRKVDFAGVRQR